MNIESIKAFKKASDIKRINIKEAIRMKVLPFLFLHRGKATDVFVSFTF